MITVPMSASMYQAVVANLTGGQGGDQVSSWFVLNVLLTSNKVQGFIVN